MEERTSKQCVATLAAAWLAVSQPFGLADNALPPNRAMSMPRPHGLEVRRQASRD